MKTKTIKPGFWLAAGRKKNNNQKNLAKSYWLLNHNPSELGQRIVQSELLASLRDTQQIVIEEEQYATYIRYRERHPLPAGEENGRTEATINMIKKGFDLNIIDNILAMNFSEHSQLVIKVGKDKR